MSYTYYLRSEQNFFVPAEFVPQVEELCGSSRWEFTKDNGNIIAAYHCDSSILEEELLERIAPYVRDGSYIEVAGDEDDDLFRLVFEHGQCKRCHATIAWPSVDQQAALLAARAHAGQTRKASVVPGVPTFAHLEEVAAMVRGIGGTPEQIAAAYLHDTLEDTGLSPYEIAQE